jgi:transcriptional regulator with GAF, ATPase, and Fis domain
MSEVGTLVRGWKGLEGSSYRVTVVGGPDRGAAIEVSGSAPAATLVGQSASCALRLTDPEVSRRHVSLSATPLGLELADLRSTNGVWVNGVRVRDAILAGGERVTLGASTLDVQLDVAATHQRAEPPPDAAGFGRIVGQSPEMRRIYPLLARLAAASAPVVIEGETGTGKELVAESLHEMGPRADGPFIVFDCTAVPANLLESALFGHERGAFTGAVQQKKGVFELAHGGTLFLDEIGDLELSLQPKLLRALERSEVGRVGSSRWEKVDVRVIAATRRDLDREVQLGRFRDDLFYRLAITRVELPPLRRRTGDVGFLARRFWRDLGGAGQPLPVALFQRYEEYAWPGNVRELRNAIARRVALGDMVDGPGFAPGLSSGSASGSSRDGDGILDAILGENLPLPRARERIVDEFERRYIERVLAQHGGNVTHAAASSGIARRYFNTIRARLGRP